VREHRCESGGLTGATFKSSRFRPCSPSIWLVRFWRNASALAIASALATQVVCSCYFELLQIDLRSPLTKLSLSLLLRADEPWLHAIAGVVTIASKFVLQIEGR
jgi:hypothetical protein